MTLVIVHVLDGGAAVELSRAAELRIKLAVIAAAAFLVLDALGVDG